MPEPDDERLSQDEWEAAEGARHGWVDLSRYPATDPDEAITSDELAAVRSAFRHDSAPGIDEATWQSMLDASVRPSSEVADDGDDLAPDDHAGSSDDSGWPVPDADSDDGWPADDGWTGHHDSDDTPWT